ncbi:MAG: LacI family transcriptional regulator, partial [Rariglobus sp.]
RGWQAAWLAFGPRGAAKRLWLQNDEPEAERAAWLEAMAPDALVADNGLALLLALARLPALTRERCATLSWTGDGEFAGIDQDYDEIAAHAVDLVVTQLQRNERGLPSPPPMLLFPGRWREAK